MFSYSQTTTFLIKSLLVIFFGLICFLRIFAISPLNSHSSSSPEEKKIWEELKQESFNKTSSNPKTLMLNNKTLLTQKNKIFSQSLEKLNEKELYGKSIELFKTKDLTQLRIVLTKLKEKFPESTFIDRVTYLMGLTEMEKNAFVSALKNFETIIQEYPTGKKRVGALFAKAVVYKRLNLKTQSHNVFSQVIKEYPGSPESQRAVMELKLLESTQQ